MADGSLRAVRDDHLLRDCVVVAEDPAELALDPLARQRLAVEDEHVPAGVRAAQQVARGRHRRLGRALRAPDTGDLRLVLRAAPSLKNPRSGTSSMPLARR